ncbi:MAG: hypothetical protein RDU20_09720 [Desulfomonilaceae bacterium]|nr:hypothetical protein [Desulfomonilaceae bacterium]
MDEMDLTPKQRKWLEASQRIGPGAMTRTERETLERLYADMLPAEQQELQRYIQEKFAKEKDETETTPDVQDPIDLMERRVWTPPSAGLRKAFAKPLAESPTSEKVRSGSPRAGSPDRVFSQVEESEKIRRFRSRARELASQGVQLDLERIEACVTRVEGLHKDLAELRRSREEAGDPSVSRALREREEELDRAEKELKRLIEPVSDLLV